MSSGSKKFFFDFLETAVSFGIDRPSAASSVAIPRHRRNHLPRLPMAAPGWARWEQNFFSISPRPRCLLEVIVLAWDPFTYTDERRPESSPRAINLMSTHHLQNALFTAILKNRLIIIKQQCFCSSVSSIAKTSKDLKTSSNLGRLCRFAEKGPLRVAGQPGPVAVERRRQGARLTERVPSPASRRGRARRRGRGCPAARSRIAMRVW